MYMSGCIGVIINKLFNVPNYCYLYDNIRIVRLLSIGI